MVRRPTLAPSARMSRVFWGAPLRYAYEIVELVPGDRLVMRTSHVPFPMIYKWVAHEDRTAMTLRNRGEPKEFSRLTVPGL
jgi:hypothetical protein